jgi:hypothetical protein
MIRTFATLTIGAVIGFVTMALCLAASQKGDDDE